MPTILHKDTCVDWQLNQTYQSTPLRTHTRTRIKLCKTLRHCTFQPNQNSLFVWYRLVVARPRPVTAHQSSEGGERREESTGYLLHVSACVLSFGEALGPGQAFKPTPPLLLLPIPQERGALDPDSDLLLPSCLATSHTCTNLPSFPIVSPLTFLHNFPKSSFNQMSSPKQNFTVVLQK